MTNRTCSIDGCESIHNARGWCNKHYKRWLKWGDPHKVLSHADMFFAKVRQGPRWACWEWTAAKKQAGYGVVRIDGRNHPAHRVAYEWFVGPIPDGLTIDHRCGNTSCVNPWHLEPVGLVENIMRGDSVPARRARQTHCKRGHEFTDENTYVNPKGHRGCRTCRSAYMKQWYERNRSRT